jgi:hypothetical protein
MQDPGGIMANIKGVGTGQPKSRSQTRPPAIAQGSFAAERSLVLFLLENCFSNAPPVTKWGGGNIDLLGNAPVATENVPPNSGHVF